MDNKRVKEAFSLVEILVALIAVSCISAALAHVITKKLKGNAISVGGGGVGGGGDGSGYGSDVSTNCNAINASGNVFYAIKTLQFAILALKVVLKTNIEMMELALAMFVLISTKNA